MLMKQKQVDHARHPHPDLDTAQFESIDAWLSVFVRLLPLQDSDRQDIAGELESHLRERVRDLMIAGQDESQAVQTAVEELGNTAELATRFGQAHSYPRRRRIMHGILATAAAGIIGVGALTVVNQGSGVNYAVFEGDQPTAVMQETLNKRIAVRFQQTTLDDVAGQLAETLDKNVFINRQDCEDYGISPAGATITMMLSDVTTSRVLDLIEEQINTAGHELVWHVSDDMIELGSRERFDRRDTELVSYDIASILLTMLEEYSVDAEDAKDQIASLLTEMISPDDWVEMGGVAARMNFVSGKLFVEAPRRMHKQVAWILEELSDGRKAADAGGVMGGPFGAAAGGGPGTVGIEPGDVLRIEVFELMKVGEAYVSVQTVGAEQEVRLPHVGGVSTNGRTLAQVERALRDELADMIKDPIVTVVRHAPAGGGIGVASTTTGQRGAAGFGAAGGGGSGGMANPGFSGGGAGGSSGLKSTGSGTGGPGAASTGAGGGAGGAGTTNAPNRSDAERE